MENHGKKNQANQLISSLQRLLQSILIFPRYGAQVKKGQDPRSMKEKLRFSID